MDKIGIHAKNLTKKNSQSANINSEDIAQEDGKVTVNLFVQISDLSRMTTFQSEVLSFILKDFDGHSLKL